MNTNKSNHLIRNSVKSVEKMMHWSPDTIKLKQPAASADQLITMDHIFNFLIWLAALAIGLGVLAWFATFGLSLLYIAGACILAAFAWVWQKLIKSK